MVRTAIVDDNLEKYLSAVSRDNNYAVGLILGQVIKVTINFVNICWCFRFLVMFRQRLYYTLCQNSTSADGRW